jgi:preprotein translocase subunit YajC
LLALAFMPSDQGGGSAAGTLIMLAMFVAIFYLLLIRPQRQQQKRHQQMVKDLRRGDEVTTIGGIVGKIIHVKDDHLTIKTGEDTRLVIERDKVARKLAAGPEEES